jgi:hypothetical protein
VDLTKYGNRFTSTAGEDAGGRFSQQDSLNVIDDPRGYRYAYAHCNPVNHTDPIRRSICTLTIQGLVLGLGAAFFATLAATGGGVVLGSVISAEVAGGISAAMGGAGVTVEFLAGIFCDQREGRPLGTAAWIGIVAGASGVVLTLVALRTPAPSTKRTLNLSAAVLFVAMVVLIIIGES